jgi:hypothetical protein
MTTIGSAERRDGGKADPCMCGIAPAVFRDSGHSERLLCQHKADGAAGRKAAIRYTCSAGKPRPKSGPSGKAFFRPKSLRVR